MEKHEYLNEERYQRNKKKISKIALIVLLIGSIIGGSLIATGIINQQKINSKYSNKSKAELEEDIVEERIKLENIKVELETKRDEELKKEKQKLETKKAELQAKGVKYDSFAKYDEGEKYDLKIVAKVLDPSFDNCSFDEYKNNELTLAYCLISNKNDENSKGITAINNALDANFNYCSFDATKNNSYTSKYCSLKLELKNITDFNKNFESSKYVPFYMFGSFIIITSCMISFSIFMMTKRRELLAFHAQQVIPVAQENFQKMSDTLSKVRGNMAKEIAKGIEEGKAEAKVPRVVKCPHCGADNEIIGLTGVCEYCQSKISYKE